jgi:hypothetical protein
MCQEFPAEGPHEAVAFARRYENLPAFAILSIEIALRVVLELGGHRPAKGLDNAHPL